MLCRGFLPRWVCAARETTVPFSSPTARRCRRQLITAAAAASTLRTRNRFASRHSERSEESPAVCLRCGILIRGLRRERLLRRRGRSRSPLRTRRPTLRRRRAGEAVSPLLSSHTQSARALRTLRAIGFEFTAIALRAILDFAALPRTHADARSRNEPARGDPIAPSTQTPVPDRTDGLKLSLSRRPQAPRIHALDPAAASRGGRLPIPREPNPSHKQKSQLP